MGRDRRYRGEPQSTGAMLRVVGDDFERSIEIANENLRGVVDVAAKVRQVALPVVFKKWPAQLFLKLRKRH